MVSNNESQRPEDDSPESPQPGTEKQRQLDRKQSIELSLRKKAEEQLAMTEESLELMIEGAENYAFFIMDCDGAIVTWNRGAARIFGWTEDEILWQAFEVLFTDGDRQQEIPAKELENAMKSGAADDDRWHIRKDGTRFWAHGVTTALKRESVRGFAKIVRDLTERKEAEDRIRQSEEEYRSLVEQVSDYAIFRVDTDGRAMTWNRGVERVLGFAEDEFIGMNASSLFPPEDVDKGVPQQELDEATRTGVASNTRWMMKKGGNRFYAVGMTTAIRNDAGELQGFTKFMQDQSEQKQQSDELAEKTKQLAKTNEQKDHFLAVLSHELRNPLAPIRTAAELICAEKGQTPIAQEACSILQRQLHVMVHLVNDLLEASRISSGKVRLQKEVFDVRDVTRRAIESTRFLIKGRNQQLSVSLSDDAIFLNADPVRIEQIVVNLLTNAAKYTPEGGHIWLTVDREDDMVCVRVRDNGEGIAADNLPHLFTLFSQADRSADSSEGGLGIGLALVRSLVEMHGGSVEAQSEGIGKGSEFTVRLPVTASPVAESVEPPSLDPPRTKPTMRILVVDDNADAAKLVSMLLTAKGYTVREEHGGAAGLVAAKEFGPHVVLLDIGMPMMNGYEFARRLRRREAHENVVLVAVTGFGQDIDQRQSKAAGIDHHLVKPVEGEVLLQLLEEIEAR